LSIAERSLHPNLGLYPYRAAGHLTKVSFLSYPPQLISILAPRQRFNSMNSDISKIFGAARPTGNSSNVAKPRNLENLPGEKQWQVCPNCNNWYCNSSFSQTPSEAQVNYVNLVNGGTYDDFGYEDILASQHPPGFDIVGPQFQSFFGTQM
jgi:hypothetical protein